MDLLHVNINTDVLILIMIEQRPANDQLPSVLQSADCLKIFNLYNTTLSLG